MQQAYLMAKQEYGSPTEWDLNMDLNSDNEDVDDTKNFLYYLKDYLKITKYCGGAPGCWENTYKLSGTELFQRHDEQRRYAKAILGDGEAILTYVLSSDCTYLYGNIKDICGFYRIDVNGSRKPNTMGRDVFTFYITKERIVPAGTAEETGSASFESSCADVSTHEGRGCTAWVLYNENMDYLHCSNLSLNGKKTCSDK